MLMQELLNEQDWQDLNEALSFRQKPRRPSVVRKPKRPPYAAPPKPLPRPKQQVSAKQAAPSVRQPYQPIKTARPLPQPPLNTNVRSPNYLDQRAISMLPPHKRPTPLWKFFNDM